MFINYNISFLHILTAAAEKTSEKMSCECGYNISQKSSDFHDILNLSQSDFYLIFFQKSRIMTIECLEAGAKVVLTTFRLHQLAIGITLASEPSFKHHGKKHSTPRFLRSC